MVRYCVAPNKRTYEFQPATSVFSHVFNSLLLVTAIILLFNWSKMNKNVNSPPEKWLCWFWQPGVPGAPGRMQYCLLPERRAGHAHAQRPSLLLLSNDRLTVDKHGLMTSLQLAHWATRWLRTLEMYFPKWPTLATQLASPLWPCDLWWLLCDPRDVTVYWKIEVHTPCAL